MMDKVLITESVSCEIGYFMLVKGDHMKEQIAVAGKGQECHLSAVTANRNCGNAQNKKFEPAAAQFVQQSW
jgi:hypothetical protein